MTAEIELNKLAAADPDSASPRLVVSVLRCMEEAAAVVPVWRELAAEINADPDFFAAVIANRTEIVRPHVLTVERDGKLIAILVARLENTRVRARFGYLTAVATPAKAIVTVYGGFLGECSEEVCRAILESLRGALANGEAELLHFAPLPLDHSLHAVLRSGPRGLLASRGEEPILHWQLALTESLDALLAKRSSKARSNIRKHQKRLETAFSDRIEFNIVRNADELDTLMSEMDELTSKTYKRRLGVGFRNTPDWRAILMLGFEMEWLRIYVLRINGNLVSYCLSYIYKRKALRFNSAYDPDFASYRIGRYILLKMFEDLCADPAADNYDYGFGDAEYKREFATYHWKEAGVTLYAMSARGVALWGAVRLTDAAARGARWVVRQIGLEQHLKTLARRSFKRREI